MGRHRSYPPLNVFLNGRIIGQLFRERIGAISFAYDRSWLSWQMAFPVSMSLPLREEHYIGASVIAVFENFLPDNEPVRRRVAERVGAQGSDTYSLLSTIGRDCIGALQFLPDGESPQASDHLSGEERSENQIAAMLRDLEATPLGVRHETDFRISVAGAQEKTALLFHQGRWIEPTGTTPTTHIIKPQIGMRPNGIDLRKSVENEYLCLKLMENFGLRVAHSEMAVFGDQKALVVERFDRMWTNSGRLIRLPQEDMCQALSIPPAQKYQRDGGPGIVDIMNLLRGSDEPEQDRLDFFKTSVLFWLIGATDGHGKNFSINLWPSKQFRLTPLYDILTAQPNVNAQQIRWENFRLAMRMGKSNHYRIEDLLGRHIMETGVASGLSKNNVEQIFEQIHQQAAKAVAMTSTKLPKNFPSIFLDSITTAMNDRLKKLE